MLQVHSDHKLEELEPALRFSAQRNGASILYVSHLGHLLQDRGLPVPHDANIFALSLPELYAALLSSDIRFAAFLPCRIAVCTQGEGVTLEAESPRDVCNLLNRPDLERLAAPLEAALHSIMEEAAKAAPAARHEQMSHHPTKLGATEDQVNMRDSLPQRIDGRGTKLEEMAGTGKHDAPGG